jgi:hypothetical protein
MGAWIETNSPALLAFICLVAPHMGAWIETYQQKEMQTATQSRPTWARGLKRQHIYRKLLSGVKNVIL